MTSAFEHLYLNLTPNTIVIQNQTTEFTSAAFLKRIHAPVRVKQPPPLFVFPPLRDGAIQLVHAHPEPPLMTVSGIAMQWIPSIADVHCPVPIADAEGIIVPLEVARFLAHGRHTLMEHVTKRTGQLNVFATDPQCEHITQNEAGETIVITDKLVVHKVFDLCAENRDARVRKSARV